MGKLTKIAVMVSLLIALTSCTGLFNEAPQEEWGQVKVWVTTADQSKLLQPEEDITFTFDDESHDTTITIDEEVKYQQMDGFGAAMTDSSAWLIANKLKPEQQDELMKKLFDHDLGIGISYLRLPMGASDFALSMYTYNDVPEGQRDPELQQFSVEHDKTYIIPTLVQAREINPELKLMASPWSAPAWMKTSESLIGGSLKREYYQAYANYFTKFIQAYEKEGLPIDAVTPQNEPHHEPADYPGMRMEAMDQAEFIKNNLGPAFEENGLNTKIVIWDHNWDEPNYPIAVLNDAEAKPYIAGSAFHGYAGDVQNQSKVHDKHPDHAIYFTESSGGEWATDFGGNLKWDMQNLVIGASRNWARTVLKWNLALDENHGPTNGGCQDCRGIITIDQTGNVTFNEEYYAFGHASKFVKPGAHRIDSNTFGNGNIENVAFKNPDGTKVMVAINSASEEKKFKVRWGEKSFLYKLPPGAAASFVWSGTPEE
ncbi:glycoside hydrolase family 30 protein [Paenibacillus sp. sgz302251]|uniref:glycoside hydrolase family 30 protein n=1 Tax=Paenibacillus sp. sgz302251 TaxID=3414493 RepID=UPI003C7E29FF